MTIDDGLLIELKEQAQQEHTSLSRLINRVLRHGIQDLRGTSKRQRPFRQRTYPMVQPKVNLDKALALAASLEEYEICEKLARRKWRSSI